MPPPAPTCAELLSLWMTAGEHVDTHWEIVIGVGTAAVGLFFSLGRSRRAEVEVLVAFTVVVVAVDGLMRWTLDRLYNVQHAFDQRAVEVCGKAGEDGQKALEVIAVAGSEVSHANFALIAAGVAVIIFVLGFLQARAKPPQRVGGG